MPLAVNEPTAMKSAGAPRAAGGGGDWCAPRRFALLLALFVFIPFWNVLLGLDTFAVRDFGIFSYPVAFIPTAVLLAGGIAVVESAELLRPPLFSPV